MNTLDEDRQTDVIYVVFKKAFDSVNHEMLIIKLKYYGIGDLTRWFDSYLHDKTQRFFISGPASTWLPVKSGVPQGSILGPLLFLLFINDLPNVIQYCKVDLFADDAKMYKKVVTEEDCVNLQKDLDSVYQWSIKWGLSFNVSKCKLICVTRSKKLVLFNYNVNGDVLECVNEMSDLGVIYH